MSLFLHLIIKEGRFFRYKEPSFFIVAMQSVRINFVDDFWIINIKMYGVIDIFAKFAAVFAP